MRRLSYFDLIFSIFLIWSMMCPQELCAQEPSRTSAIISGTIASGNDIDSILFLFLKDSSTRSSEFYADSSKWVVTENKRFSIQVPVIKGYEGNFVSIYLNPKRDPTHNIPISDDFSLENYRVEAGDDIRIVIEEDTVLFEGRGYEKWACQWNMIQASEDVEKQRRQYSRLGGTFDHMGFSMAKHQAQLAVLEEYKPFLSEVALINLKSIAYETLTAPTAVISFMLRDSREATQKEGQQMYEQHFASLRLDTSSSVAYLSSRYPTILTNLIRLEYAYLGYMSQQRPENIYEYIVTKYSGALRDKVLLLALDVDIGASQISDTLVSYLSSVISTPQYVQELHNKTTPFLSGAPVLDSEFKDKNDRPVRLSDFKGKVVLVDMWFTGCSGCVAVANALPAVEEAFENEDVVFVSLSVDRKKDIWLKSIDPTVETKEIDKLRYTHYTTPTTVYLYTGGTGSNNDFIQTYVPTGAFPHLLLIGKDGKVFSADVPKPGFYSNAVEDLKELIAKALENYLIDPEKI